MADILEGILESGCAVQPPVLAILAEARQGRKKRKAVNPQPRRGCPHARGPFSKPVELKVAALLEMCQAGLVFKTVERLYKISVPAMQRFFHDFMQLQSAIAASVFLLV